ncbi:MAG: hypothetical protein WAO40_04940 [Candidatus Nanopelagicales bacterium]
MTDLELAQALIDAGIPVVVCRPTQRWVPGSPKPDVQHPAPMAVVA